MIENIIRYAVKNKVVIGSLIVALIIWGLFSLRNLSVDAVPDITNNQVQILTTTRNLSTLDVEQFISYPIEMEMANLPGVKEIRSINKFGLSVVTIVFEDNMGTYLPRQLIAEKIKAAKEKIPEGFGDPEMGPISTGLGEIYQYLVDVKPGYEDKYTDMDLRTIQDWIVKRQLSGIDGVVEVNTWGGHLKQYEIAIDPLQLKAINISIDEIIEAVESNNGITGAGYIEKNNQSYFIRAEGLLHSLVDLQKVVIKNINGSPILVGDVATVGYGHAPRFGAITGNGEGEKVMGQIMLLKGANTKKVLQNVIDRVAEIQPTLPEGVFINPFLERSKLLKSTTDTVYENLLLGGLIVIFVVILLLGNFRSGLIIASLIPLSLLFALGLMNVFGVSANLMSLGAIDFGIIIDGAIIIVEFILFSMTQSSSTLKGLTGKAYRDKKDEIAINNSSSMMRSAIFGQVIILIVFLPILTLEGVEGKMFRPMAMTFSFALIGAMILCLTYVPVMASLFMKPVNSKNNFSTKVNDFLKRLYNPIIHLVMRFKKTVVLLSLMIMGFSAYLFSGMGGEFVPTLDEGDIVIQPLIASGTSLGKTIELCTIMEGIVKEKFPNEVNQVVSRIGAAEVPTDPMSMEEVDMIITLKPIKEWKRASSKDGLITVIEEELNQLPGMEYEFTQPIEMRFNELISGSRADISVKIYGEDLDLLYAKAVDAKFLIDNIKGAADVVLDKVDNIPQVKISYNRAKIAQYGLNIEELNESIQMAYAGLQVGEIFKGERRFDIVLRYQKASRSSISDIANTMINLPNGSQVPISVVADVKVIEGPAKISRDDTKRRVSVGVNVRNRDLESVVIDIKNTLSNHLDLPPGYHIKYGGQFENLKSAKNRLLVVVPLALLLIFLLLYMTFHSVAEAALIYTAIPLASIGGILLLWSRGMPFSISAGIGFIALFGIAVLNGIVLIEHYKHMKLSDFSSIKEMIIEGTKQRIRPVLLTASAAALGFLPMAISTSSGAEVQRPLATAVIGGLISSTILTLIILPILYSWLLSWRNKRTKLNRNKALILLPLLLGANMVWAQVDNEVPKQISIEEAIQSARGNSPSLNSRLLEIEKSQGLEGMKYQPGITSLSYTGDALITGNPNQMNALNVSQEFEHPRLQKRRNEVQKILTKLNNLDHAMLRNAIMLEVRNIYYELVSSKAVHNSYLDVIRDYSPYVLIANKRNQAGVSNPIESISLALEVDALKRLRDSEVWNIKSLERQLQLLIGSATAVTSNQDLKTVDQQVIGTRGSDLLSQKSQVEIERSQATLALTKSGNLPQFNVGYSLQNYYEGGLYSGVELGASIPLFTKNRNKRTKAAQIDVKIAKSKLKTTARYVEQKQELWLNKMLMMKERSLSIKQKMETQIPEMMRIAKLNYKAGSMSYLELINILKMRKELEVDYWQTVMKHNIALANYEFLIMGY
ncbi:MAG: CusA/CzcA family heavy metal efflux RND transporter [Saprospiraceae bacterium]